jgi:inorganic pyrophosphatase
VEIVSTPGPEVVQVRIEVPRGGLVKWGSDGRIDFVSPLPCPFNYGSLPGPPADDGDPPDAVLLGPRLGRGRVAEARVVGRVRFLDQGQRDDKLLCVPLGRDRGLSRAERLQAVAFFALYARIKALAGRLRGRGGPTRFQGIEG